MNIVSPRILGSVIDNSLLGREFDCSGGIDQYLQAGKYSFVYIHIAALHGNIYRPDGPQLYFFLAIKAYLPGSLITRARVCLV